MGGGNLPALGIGIFALVGIAMLAIFALVGYKLVSGLFEWQANNLQPIEDSPARLVAKRSVNTGGGDTMVSTWHYATFEFADARREEFQLSGAEYGLLAEGDEGTLRRQGTRYHGFARTVAR